MFKLEDALDCIRPPGPLERLAFEACGWPVSQRKRLLTMLEAFPGMAPAEQVRRLRLAARNFDRWLDEAASENEAALDAMERDGVYATDLRIAIDSLTMAADALERERA